MFPKNSNLTALKLLKDVSEFTSNGTAWSISYLVAIISPAAKLHLAALVVEGKPRDVDLACALEDARRHVQARPVVPYHYVRWVRAVEAFVGTIQRSKGLF